MSSYMTESQGFPPWMSSTHKQDFTVQSDLVRTYKCFFFFPHPSALIMSWTKRTKDVFTSTLTKAGKTEFLLQRFSCSMIQHTEEQHHLLFCSVYGPKWSWESGAKNSKGLNSYSYFSKYVSFGVWFFLLNIKLRLTNNIY